MRLPPLLVESQFFQFSSLKEFLWAIGETVDQAEIDEISRLSLLCLPPITSVGALSALLGVNSGILWSMVHRPQRYYRRFSIRKGRGLRNIDAPRVALKVIQKWLSVQLSRHHLVDAHVFGFVPGLSHVQAASVHTNASWVFSVDVENFFGTTPKGVVAVSLTRLGYSAESAELISKFCCLNEVLPQGAPSSPVLSNIAFLPIDRELASISKVYGVRLSRYADDIVFSGDGVFPSQLQFDVEQIFESSPWRLAASKTELASLPGRLKVHGLLVHGSRVRLTKGYRNRLRAFRHLLQGGKILDEDLRRVRSHLAFSDFIDQQTTVASSNLSLSKHSSQKLT